MEINLFLLANEVVFLGPQQPSSIELVQQFGVQGQNLSALLGLCLKVCLSFGKWNKHRCRDRGRSVTLDGCCGCRGTPEWNGSPQALYCALPGAESMSYVFADGANSFSALSSNCQASTDCSFGKCGDLHALKRSSC